MDEINMNVGDNSEALVIIDDSENEAIPIRVQYGVAAMFYLMKIHYPSKGIFFDLNWKEMKDVLLVGKIVVLVFMPFHLICPYELDDDGSAGDLKKHSHNEFSIVMVQENEVLEDQSSVETGRHATFIGVYDGHGGCEVATYFCDQAITVPNFL
ncbi:Protein phosphatase 2C family protein [Perilla frutescens var. frutescens]|nr:Protein phosphatase 2C family protein [Perilla frutescens var. frutescens]